MRRISLVIAALIELGGCAVGRNYHPPQTSVDAHFTGASEPGLAEAARVERYWTAFDDELLNSLVTDALA